MELMQFIVQHWTTEMSSARKHWLLYVNKYGWSEAFTSSHKVNVFI